MTAAIASELIRGESATFVARGSDAATFFLLYSTCTKSSCQHRETAMLHMLK